MGDIQVKYEQGVESMELYLNEELVFRNVEASTDSEVLAYLAGELYQKGYVKEEYIQAIQDREKNTQRDCHQRPRNCYSPRKL